MTFEPELRACPPWVIEEMIWAQLDLPEQIASSADAGRLASHQRNAVEAGEPVLFTGCATSTNPDLIRREQSAHRHAAGVSAWLRGCAGVGM